MQNVLRFFFYLRYLLHFSSGKMVAAYYQWAPDSMLDKQSVRRMFDYYFDLGLSSIAFEIADTMIQRDSNEDMYYFMRSSVFCRHDQYEDGFEDISSALDIAPRNVEYWIFRAAIFRELEKYEEAIADLKQSIRYARETVSAPQWFEIGINYIQLKDYEQAKAAFSEAVKEEAVAIPTYYYRLAQSNDFLNDRDTAIALLEKSVQLNLQVEEQIKKSEQTVYDRSPYDVARITEFLIEVYEQGMFTPTLCKFYYAAERWEEALELLERSIECLPEHYQLLLERCKCLRSLRRLDEALTYLNQLVEMDGPLEQTLVERAHLHRLRDEEELALADFLRAREIDPELPYVDYWIAGSHVVLEQMNEALLSFSKALEYDAEDIDCYMERAEVYESLGMPDLAAADYDRAVELQDIESTRMQRARFLWRSDRPDEALIDLQKALELNPDLAEEEHFRYLRGMLFMEIENFSLALDDFSKVLEHDPERELIFERRARCFIELGMQEEALADCNQGLTYQPEYSPLLWTRGFLLYRMGDYGAALRDSLEYLRLNPEDASAHYNLALVYVHLFEYKNALAQFSLSIARDPYHVDAYYQRAHVWEKLLDFDRVAQDLANWVFYSRGEHSYEKRVAKLRELESFDEMIIDDAVAQLTKLYGQNHSNLLH